MNRRDIRSIAVFLILAFGLSWLIALPLWLGEGLLSPWFPLISLAMMFTPAIATLLVVFFIDKPSRSVRALGIWPLKPVGRFIGYLALGLIVPVALVLIALPIGAALGLYPADFENFSGFQQLVDAQLADAGVSDMAIPIGVLVAAQLANIPIGAAINLIPALGEELGWRGWLLPKLMKLGTIPALLLSGVIWGLWHAPLILLGYNYAGAPGWLALIMMVGMCIIIGAVFAWLRLRSESVWPAALAHAAFNAAAGAHLVFAQAGAEIDTTQATILGWSGWIVPLILVVVLLATGQFTPAPQKRRLEEESTHLQ
ncbi:MAG: CPBP family glutamic-type intramembrane protease [Gulosibacter sp.]|uniref:CPBP family glutamic-type intramembrane protease n=1 Tax=Gulosibacter sp. TaxID=2817531 RepID=UPI003F9211DF